MAVQLQEAGEHAAIIVGDIYPLLPPDDDDAAGREPEPGEQAGREDRERPSPEEIEERKWARTLELVRREAGNVLGAISEEELLLLAAVFHKSGILAKAHEFGTFDGDMLLLVADVGKGVGDKDGSGINFTALWEQNVSGEITEVHLPCTHSGITQPEMLGEAWTGISAWLGLDG
jgi:hypothetical protein